MIAKYLFIIFVIDGKDVKFISLFTLLYIFILIYMHEIPIWQKGVMDWMWKANNVYNVHICKYLIRTYYLQRTYNQTSKSSFLREKRRT